MAKKKENEFFYGFELGVKRKLTDKQYANLIYDLNKEIVDNEYRRNIAVFESTDGADYKHFKNKYPTPLDFLYTNVKNYAFYRKLTFNQAMRKFALDRLVGERATFANNFISGMQNNAPDYYEQFMAMVSAEGGTFDINRLQYEGDATYSYLCHNNVRIVIELIDSPFEYLITVDDSEMGNQKVVVNKEGANG